MESLEQEMARKFQEGLDFIAENERDAHLFGRFPLDARLDDKTGWDDKTFFSTYAPQKKLKHPSEALQNSVASEFWVGMASGRIYTEGFPEKAMLMLMSMPSPSDHDRLLFDFFLCKQGEDWDIRTTKPTSLSLNQKTGVHADEREFWYKMSTVWSGEAQESEVELNRYRKWGFAIIGMTLMYGLRIGCMPLDSIKRSFENRFSQNVITLYGSLKRQHVYPPSEDFISSMTMGFGRGPSSFKMPMGLILANYVYQRIVNPNPRNQGVLDSGIIVHSRFTGIGIMKTFFDVLNTYGYKNTGNLIADLTTTRTLEIARDIRQLISESLEGEKSATGIYEPWNEAMSKSKQMSWPWARLFDNKYFKDFTYESHVLISCRLIAMVAIIPGREDILKAFFARREIIKEIIITEKIRTRVIYDKRCGSQGSAVEDI